MNNIIILILTTAILFIILLYFQSRKKQLKVLHEKSDEKPNPKPLVYKPKSEKDCPCCQANHPNQATARYHQSLRVKLSQQVQRKGKLEPIRYRRSTPAMAAGLTRRRWSIQELISYPLM